VNTLQVNENVLCYIKQTSVQIPEAFLQRGHWKLFQMH